jgi:hypothetical protein
MGKDQVRAEGWYVDPFGRHEARWFSDGIPTALVKDRHQEGKDPPPQGGWDGPLVPQDGEPPREGEDLLRADEEGPPDVGTAVFDEAAER